MLIGALFLVERQAKDFSVEQRLALRQAESAPVLAQPREKLLEWKEQLLPKHPMAEAINYALNHWAELNVFVTMARYRWTTMFPNGR
jgi:transposase